MSLRRHRRARCRSDVISESMDSFVRACAHPDCDRLGTHPAPRDRAQLRDYLWFCLEHVRVYNAAWNYYAGMSEAEIEAEIRNDTVWQRPTWRFGMHHFDSLRDPFDVLAEDEPPVREQRPQKRPPPEVARALAVFGLQSQVTADEVKARYKELVKLHHPDANGGDKDAEDRLKVINVAYAFLMRVVAR